MAVTVSIETPLQDEVRVLVGELNDHLLPLSPIEFQFKMTVEQMAGDDTTVFVARNEAGEAVGIGALKVISANEAEVKRMYTRAVARGRGVGKALLARIEAEARNAAIRVLRLETGVHQTAAIGLYEGWGFRRREPFGHYADLPPHSIATSAFYEKLL